MLVQTHSSLKCVLPTCLYNEKSAEVCEGEKKYHLYFLSSLLCIIFLPSHSVITLGLNLEISLLV